MKILTKLSLFSEARHSGDLPQLDWSDAWQAANTELEDVYPDSTSEEIVRCLKSTHREWFGLRWSYTLVRRANNKISGNRSCNGTLLCCNSKMFQRS